MMTNNKLVKIDTGLYLVMPIKTKIQKKKKNNSFLILIPSLILAGTITMGYLDLKVKNIEALETIARLESYCIKLKLENDEQEAYYKSHIDLNEIRIKAYSLNMKYPEEDQVIYFENIDDDYVVTNF